MRKKAGCSTLCTYVGGEADTNTFIVHMRAGIKGHLILSRVILFLSFDDSEKVIDKEVFHLRLADKFSPEQGLEVQGPLLVPEVCHPLHLSDFPINSIRSICSSVC